MGFVKVNFDGSICDVKDGAKYVIQDSDGRLLVAGGSFLFEPLVPETKLRSAWTGITSTRQEPHTEKIFIERDSITIFP